jgi:excisionase family DNA binding protein
MPPTDFLSIEQLAAALGVSSKTVRTYVEKGFLPAASHRGGCRVYWSRSVVDEFRAALPREKRILPIQRFGRPVEVRG